MTVFGHSPTYLAIVFSVTGVDAIIADHFKVVFWDVLDEHFYKVHYGYRSGNKDVIFVPVVVKGNCIAIIVINAGSCNHRSAKVTSDVFYGILRRKISRLCINIKAVLMFFVNGRFYGLERRAEFNFQLV